jgi:hypothetical protein
MSRAVPLLSVYAYMASRGRTFLGGRVPVSSVPALREPRISRGCFSFLYCDQSFCIYMYTRDGAVGCGTALQHGRSRVR